MVECKNCPYFYKGEDDDFCYCHFEGNYLAPCEEDDGPVYENEDYDNMSDEDWEQELNDEEDFDDEKVFE